MPTEQTSSKKKDCPELKREERACRKLAMQQPDKTGGIDITGRYEQAENPPQFTCQINQAGTHIEGWFQLFFAATKGEKFSQKFKSLKAEDLKLFPPMFTFSGDLVDFALKKFNIEIFDDFHPTRKGKKTGTGSIQLNKVNPVILTIDLKTALFDKDIKLKHKIKTTRYFSKKPRLSELTLSHLPEKLRKVIEPVEITPIPNFYLQEIEQIFSRQVIIGVIEKWLAFFGNSSETQKQVLFIYDKYLEMLCELYPPDTIPKLLEIWNVKETLVKKNLATIINDFLKIFNWDIKNPAYTREQLLPLNNLLEDFFSRFPPSLVPALSWNIKYYLSTEAHQSGETRRTLLEWLKLIASRTPLNGLSYITSQGLDLVDDYHCNTYNYKAVIKVIGLSVGIKSPFGGGGFRGNIYIKKYRNEIRNRISTSSKKKEVGFEWETTFEIAMFHLGIAKPSIISLLVGLQTYGDAQTHYEWKQDNFPGWGIMLDASGWLMHGAGGSLGFTKLKIEGSTPIFPPIEFNLSWPPALVFGEGAGIGGNAFVVYIFKPGEEKGIQDKSLVSAISEKTLQSSVTGKIHFDFGCATLTKEGRELIRRFCAKELFFLGSPLSSLEIYGHTDTVDCERRNLELSKMRAMNVLQAIKDILGKNFAIPKSSITTKGYGEQYARESISDKTQSQEWRKVEIKLNGINRVRLLG